MSDARKVALGFFLSVGALSIVLIVVGVVTSDPPRCGTEIGVMVEAQLAVEGRLVAPRSARHVGNPRLALIDERSCLWRVLGQVDAQNRFGAMIRTTYMVDLRKAGDRWVVESVLVN